MAIMGRVDEPMLRELVRAGVARDVTAVADGDRWRIEVRVGMEARVLQTKRRSIRHFKSIDTLTRYLKDLGVAQWQMDAAEFSGQRSAA